MGLFLLWKDSANSVWRHTLDDVKVKCGFGAFINGRVRPFFNISCFGERLIIINRPIPKKQLLIFIYLWLSHQNFILWTFIWYYDALWRQKKTFRKAKRVLILIIFSQLMEYTHASLKVGNWKHLLFFSHIYYIYIWHISLIFFMLSQIKLLCCTTQKKKACMKTNIMPLTFFF